MVTTLPNRATPGWRASRSGAPAWEFSGSRGTFCNICAVYSSDNVVRSVLSSLLACITERRSCLGPISEAEMNSGVLYIHLLHNNNGIESAHITKRRPSLVPTSEAEFINAVPATTRSVVCSVELCVKPCLASGKLHAPWH